MTPLQRGRLGGVLAAAAQAAGDTDIDTPASVCLIAGAFARHLNDRIDEDGLRTALLMPLVPQLVGSRLPVTPFNTDEGATVAGYRSFLALDWSLRVALPMWWSDIAPVAPVVDLLRSLPPLVSLADVHEASVRLNASRWPLLGQINLSTVSIADAMCIERAVYDSAIGSDPRHPQMWEAFNAAGTIAWWLLGVVRTDPRRPVLGVVTPPYVALRQERVWRSAAARLEALLAVNAGTTKAALLALSERGAAR